ncbi:hypothetical protein [Glycomyces algeriensis]|uniref:Uncharacterized protein n=1 Tax=Glycomyces algeriensis TaxID=256037 RepID=A0A9W6G9F0_9ACTN|nr:hypothetical protein [Glycomyces algeriensis]MDA1364971.1 hypothetical protein [Glycomyces algeriensis]MDR7349968.1 hypothetical protein [Glycomyces algeriensis]GLI42678.1 hypothetical protein GALLR39Z86_25280 [Glycomyces algeriensis]
MRVVYRILAYVIAAEVALQAAFMAYAIAGLYIWVQDGGVLDSAVMESEDIPFDESVGFMLHGINGMMVVPFLALVLLIISFFAKIKGGIRFAVILLLWVALQIFLGLFGHEAAIFGLLHGLVAFAVYGTAFMAGFRAKKPATEPAVGNAPQ